MYTQYTMQDLDMLAKKEVDKLLAEGGFLSYKSDNWEVEDYDFNINIPVCMPTEEYYPILNITVKLTNIRKEHPDQTICFSEYL